MGRSAAVFTIALALGTTILASEAGAQPTVISACPFPITAPGSYVLVRNLTASGNCITIMADSLTIDLAGFSISGNGTGEAIVTQRPSDKNLRGVVVRNGSVSNFEDGVSLFQTTGPVIEKLQVFGNDHDGIVARGGIVRDNVVVDNGHIGIDSADEYGTVTGNYASGNGVTFPVTAAGISAVGIVSGNMVLGTKSSDGIRAFTGSTVIGNDVRDSAVGLTVDCPSNVINNMTFRNTVNIRLNPGEGDCNDINNVPPPPR